MKISFAEANEHHLSEYFKRRVKAKVPLRIVKKEIEFTKAYFEKEKGKKIFLPLNSLIESRKSIYILKKEEIDLFFENINDTFYYMIFRLIFGSGLRLREVLNLRVNDIDIVNMKIYIRVLRNNENRKTILAKSMKLELISFLSQISRKDMFIFTKRSKYLSTRRVIAERTVQKCLRNTCDKLNLNYITINSLRDAFIFSLLYSGLDPRLISQMVGFKSSQSILRYTKHIQDLNREIISPLDQYFEEKSLYSRKV